MHDRPRSREIYRRLCKTIPGGVNSPVRAWKGLHDTPMVADRGEGDTLYDADGNAYVDYCGSWGPLILGHAHPYVAEAVKKRIDKGLSFGVTTEIEAELAEKIASLVPSVEKVRFVSSGTEATMSAVRLARGYTKKPVVMKFTGHYHGHADLFLVKAGSGVAQLNATSSSLGIPEEAICHTVCLPFNDAGALRAFFASPKAKDLAAVILEPVAGNMGVVPADQAWMRLLREETQKTGALLIFDEVMTGFRLSLSGAQGIYSVTPDLTTFGKVVGGGMPMAAFGGRRDIMDHLAPLGGVYQAGTLSGNPLAMEAGLRTLEVLERDGVYEELKEKTQFIVKPVEEMLKSSGAEACIQSVGSMFTLFLGRTSVKNFEEAQQLDLEGFKDYFLHMVEEGVFMAPSQFEACFMSLAHTADHLTKTRDAQLKWLSSKVGEGLRILG